MPRSPVRLRLIVGSLSAGGGLLFAAAAPAADPAPPAFPAAADGPAPWVGVRAPRTAGERAGMAEALAWWDGDAPAHAPAPAVTPIPVEPDPAAEGVVTVAAVAPAAPGTVAEPAAPARAVAPARRVAADPPRLAWWADPLQDGADLDDSDDADGEDDADGDEDGDEDAADASDEQDRLDEADPQPGALTCEAVPCLFTPLREISVGLDTPTIVLAETVRTTTEASASGACERQVPVSYKTVETPPGAVDECFLLAGAVDATPYGTRPKPLAMAFCFRHRPLYFEDANLERCGNSHGPHLQPLVSAGHFFGTVPLLPWWVATRPPHDCVPATPFCPPCGEYDVVENFFPPSDPDSLRRGLAAEGAAAAAFFLILP